MNNKNLIRIPKQQRGKETKSKLIDAAIELFSTKGYYNTNSKEIAKTAGVATGSFYAYFKDKKSIFIEIINDIYDYCSSATFDKLNNLTNDCSREFFYNLIKEIFLLHNISPKLYKEIIIMTYSDEEINNLVSLREKLLMDRIHSYLEKWKDIIKVKDLEASSIIIFSSIENAVHMKKFSHITIDEERLINELTNLLMTYLF